MINNKKQLSLVYAIIGDDNLRKQTVYKRLNSRLFSLGDIKLNTSTFDATVHQVQEVIQTCILMPFACEKRLVIVKNAEKFNKDNTEKLIEYIKKPVSSCLLLLDFKTLAKNTKLYKAINNVSVDSIIDCKLPKNYQMLPTVKSIATSNNCIINNDAAILLLDMVGNDTITLDSEIKKLKELAKDNHIDITCVETLSKKTNAPKPWEFVGKFALRDLNACINLLHTMDENAPYILLPMICKKTRELICAKSFGKNADDNTIANELKINSWLCRGLSAASKKWSSSELSNVLKLALKCDKEIKSKSQKAIYFELFLVKSLSKQGC